MLSQFRVLHNSSYQEKLYGQVDHIDVLVGIESVGEQFAGRRNRDMTGEDFKAAMKATLSDLNICSQKGLVEMFDASIGAGTVDMPYGGKYQLTETQTMVAKLPVLGGKTDTVTMMSYGFDPYLSSWSPYHGAVYAVTESVAKVVAAGGDHKKLHLTFQEYFGRMSKDPSRWSQPFSALLGAYDAQLGFGIGSIGGKDSMSGTFNEIDVPPTLVSFAVDVAKIGDVITPELKEAGDKLVQIDIERDEYDIPVYTDVCAIYDKVTELMRDGKVKAAYAVDCFGAAPAVAKMAFGNGFGVAFNDEVPLKHLFRNRIGDLILEMEPGCEEILEGRLPDNHTIIGTPQCSRRRSMTRAVLLSAVTRSRSLQFSSPFSPGRTASTIPRQPLRRPVRRRSPRCSQTSPLWISERV